MTAGGNGSSADNLEVTIQVGKAVNGRHLSSRHDLECALQLSCFIQREAPSNTQYQTEIPHSIPSTVELEWNLKLNNIVNKFVTSTME